MANQFQWTNALSTLPSLEAAVKEVTTRVKQSLAAPPELGIVFISSAYASEYPRLVPLLQAELPLPVLIGCGGAGIIGMDNQGEAVEVEDNCALSLSVAHLPGVEIKSFQILGDDLPDSDSSPQSWSELIGVSPQKQPQFILLADPFSSGINDLLEGLDFAYPGSIKVGGLASAGMVGVPNGLFDYSSTHPDEFFHQQGTVGVALSGEISVETIVAQGCRSVGPLYQITKGERNVILEMADTNNSQMATDCTPRPPLELLRELIHDLSESDRQLAQNSLFVGVIRDEFKLNLGQRDFLIRNLVGVDPRVGAVAIGDRVRPGQRIQFHLRDSQTSAEDLEKLLKNYQQQSNSESFGTGVLMFACLGRGARLYNQPNFDSNLLRSYLKDVQLGGFFCNGEIGPVGGSTFLHGYTSAFGIFRQRS
ncbi:MAG: FIST N-terminal domain-containing protein [Spirulinaceae cyanobacterium]